jgi:hypothetical protein
MSPKFAAMWQIRDVQNHGEGIKRVQAEDGKPITMEYSSFAVDGQAGLGMVIHTPATSSDAERVKRLIAQRQAAPRARFTQHQDIAARPEILKETYI